MKYIRTAGVATKNHNSKKSKDLNNLDLLKEFNTSPCGQNQY